MGTRRVAAVFVALMGVLGIVVCGNSGKKSEIFETRLHTKVLLLGAEVSVKEKNGKDTRSVERVLDRLFTANMKSAYHAGGERWSKAAGFEMQHTIELKDIDLEKNPVVDVTSVFQDWTVPKGETRLSQLFLSKGSDGINTVFPTSSMKSQLYDVPYMMPKHRVEIDLKSSFAYVNMPKSVDTIVKKKDFVKYLFGERGSVGFLPKGAHQDNVDLGKSNTNDSPEAKFSNYLWVLTKDWKFIVAPEKFWWDTHIGGSEKPMRRTTSHGDLSTLLGVKYKEDSAVFGHYSPMNEQYMIDMVKEMIGDAEDYAESSVLKASRRAIKDYELWCNAVSDQFLSEDGRDWVESAPNGENGSRFLGHCGGPARAGGRLYWIPAGLSEKELKKYLFNLGGSRTKELELVDAASAPQENGKGYWVIDGDSPFTEKNGVFLGEKHLVLLKSMLQSMGIDMNNVFVNGWSGHGSGLIHEPSFELPDDEGVDEGDRPIIEKSSGNTPSLPHSNVEVPTKVDSFRPDVLLGKVAFEKLLGKGTDGDVYRAQIKVKSVHSDGSESDEESTNAAIKVPRRLLELHHAIHEFKKYRGGADTQARLVDTWYDKIFEAKDALRALHNVESEVKNLWYLHEKGNLPGKDYILNIYGQMVIDMKAGAEEESFNNESTMPDTEALTDLHYDVARLEELIPTDKSLVEGSSPPMYAVALELCEGDMNDISGRTHGSIIRNYVGFEEMHTKENQLPLPGDKLKYGRDNYDAVFRLAKQILESLDTLANLPDGWRMVHGDMKPDNLMKQLGRSGEFFEVRLADLSFARLIPPGETAEGVSAMSRVFGTPSWMAPERMMRMNSLGPFTEEQLNNAGFGYLGVKNIIQGAKRTAFTWGHEYAGDMFSTAMILRFFATTRMPIVNRGRNYNKIYDALSQACHNFLKPDQNFDPSNVKEKLTNGLDNFVGMASLNTYLHEVFGGHNDWPVYKLFEAMERCDQSKRASPTEALALLARSGLQLDSRRGCREKCMEGCRSIRGGKKWQCQEMCNRNVWPFGSNSHEELPDTCVGWIDHDFLRNVHCMRTYYPGSLSNYGYDHVLFQNEVMQMARKEYRGHTVVVKEAKHFMKYGHLIKSEIGVNKDLLSLDSPVLDRIARWIGVVNNKKAERSKYQCHRSLLPVLSDRDGMLKPHEDETTFTDNIYDQDELAIVHEYYHDGDTLTQIKKLRKNNESRKAAELVYLYALEASKIMAELTERDDIIFQHRDMSIDNSFVKLNADGEVKEIVLADFNIAYSYLSRDGGNLDSKDYALANVHNNGHMVFGQRENTPPEVITASLYWKSEDDFSPTTSILEHTDALRELGLKEITQQEIADAGIESELHNVHQGVLLGLLIPGKHYTQDVFGMGMVVYQALMHMQGLRTPHSSDGYSIQPELLRGCFNTVEMKEPTSIYALPSVLSLRGIQDYFYANDKRSWEDIENYFLTGEDSANLLSRPIDETKRAGFVEVINLIKRMLACRVTDRPSFTEIVKRLGEEDVKEAFLLMAEIREVYSTEFADQSGYDVSGDYPRFAIVSDDAKHGA